MTIGADSKKNGKREFGGITFLEAKTGCSSVVDGGSFNNNKPNSEARGTATCGSKKKRRRGEKRIKDASRSSRPDAAVRK